MVTVGTGLSDDFEVPSDSILTGKLKNSEYLDCLPTQFVHLSDSQGEDLVRLLSSHLSLFSDTPTCTNLIEHDIEVGDALPVRQRAYGMPVGKLERMKREVDYLLQHGLAEPSCSGWASPCLLADKADGSDRFCTDLIKG